MERKGIEYLRRKLNDHKLRVDLRYECYNMKHLPDNFSLNRARELRNLFKANLGWCAKSVDSLADRLIFRKFDNDIFDFEEIFAMNNPDIFFDSAILSALIGSCCFIYIIADKEERIPRLQVIEGYNATGVIDPITGLLTEGYAILEKDEYGNAKTEAYFEPYKTTIIQGKNSYTYKHNVGYPLLVPIIHRPDAVRPFGHSRISRSCMYYTKLARRTLERADVTAEFYSFPQKYILGMDGDAETFDTWKATVSSMLRIDANSNGDKPQVGQFNVSSMSPFTEQLRTAASLFAGETGLTLDDLGFVSDNPSSSEAIKASHENLRVMARKAQRCFSSGFLNVGFLAACLRDNYNYSRSALSKTSVKWYPVFETDASAINLVGDAILKINQAIPNFADKSTVEEMTGIEGAN